VKGLTIGLVVVLAAALTLTGCGTSHPRVVPGAMSTGPVERGVASYYGDHYHGRKTASGEYYSMHAMTAAHPTLPFGTQVRVTNLDNGRTIEVRINDRGPFVDGRIIDLSRRAAARLDFIEQGVVPVTVEIIP
jgi:rare lipoprotein A